MVQDSYLRSLPVYESLRAVLLSQVIIVMMNSGSAVVMTQF